MRIQTPRMEDIFVEAAQAMFDQIVDLENPTPVLEMVVELDMESPEITLRDWLGELLYNFSTEGRIYSEFHVRLESNRFRGLARGESYDARKHPIRTELKAVTYHQLLMEQESNEWVAQVIFDV